MAPHVFVSRTVIIGEITIIENATAPLPDDIPLDDLTEYNRRAFLAESLFLSLPSVSQSKHIPPCPPHPRPPHSNN